MGMVGTIEADEITGRVQIGIVYPCIGCPAVELIEAAVRRRALEVPGVTEVRVRAEWNRVWSKGDLDRDAAERLKGYGIQV